MGVETKQHRKIGLAFEKGHIARELEKRIISDVMITFGGGMGGGSKHYYVQGEIDFGPYLCALYDVLGEGYPVEVGSNFIVSLTRKKLVIETNEVGPGAISFWNSVKVPAGTYKRYLLMGPDDTFEVVDNNFACDAEVLMITDSKGYDIKARK